MTTAGESAMAPLRNRIAELEMEYEGLRLRLDDAEDDGRALRAEVTRLEGVVAGQLETIEGQRDWLERKLDAERTLLGDLAYLHGRISTLEREWEGDEAKQRIGMLTEMLRRLADHQTNCPAYTADSLPIDPRCTCGLSAALRPAGEDHADEWRRVFWERDQARAERDTLAARVAALTKAIERAKPFVVLAGALAQARGEPFPGVIETMGLIEAALGTADATGTGTEEPG